MAACRPLFVGVGPGCGEGERADGQELHPEEGIAYQTAEDGGALRLPLSQELDGGEASLLWLGPDEVDYYQGYYAKEAQKGNGIAEGH